MRWHCLTVRKPGEADASVRRFSSWAEEQRPRGRPLSDDIPLANSLKTPRHSPLAELRTPFMTPETTAPTYVLIDGENIDWTLSDLVKRKPLPGERPRWGEIVEYFRGGGARPVVALFFLNCPGDVVPIQFVTFLRSIGIRPVLLRGEGKVVDLGIQRTLTALLHHEGAVALLSHDGDFVDEVHALVDGGRDVALVCLPERANSQFENLREQGLRFIDLERDIPNSFEVPLRRPVFTVIDVDTFDPEDFLRLD
jgi:uncharacterized protein